MTAAPLVLSVAEPEQGTEDGAPAQPSAALTPSGSGAENVVGNAQSAAVCEIGPQSAVLRILRTGAGPLLSPLQVFLDVDVGTA